MPLCIACNTRYYYQTLSEPAEPCDCGRNVSREDIEDDRSADDAPGWEDPLEENRDVD